MTEQRPEIGKVIVDAVLAVIILVAVVDAQGLPQQARMMPTVVGIATLVFLTLGIAAELFPKHAEFLKPRTPRSDDRNQMQAEQPAEWGAALRVISYVLLFWVLIFFFGFYVVPPVLVALYLGFEGGVRWRFAIPLAILATLLTLAGLAVLRVQPWIGAGPELIDGYVGGAVMPLF
ncbi:tripartite tricarboxylate transporter TctB family protein [Pseudoruegeria sp. HB172150]|uniref:tripartite tricarboxylate transporter TctB family protein n=1 Tax=Pseudoruegeria sp. HB172150 TaxID=2721164 RepID=UPI0015537E7A|nr:tripartite tricarboxylate transporter TctB family protein [Pseudoruegeria sp. HB172150]